MGGENLAEIQFENCELPLENLIIREDGFRKLLNAFNTQRCLNPSISLGLAEGAFEEAVKYARDRTAFGHAIGEFQGMRWKLAEMYRDIEAGRALLYRACADGQSVPGSVRWRRSRRCTCNEMSMRVTSEAIQVHGGYGFTDEFPVSRFYRGARYGTLGGGTTETLKELVGKKILDDLPTPTASSAWARSELSGGSNVRSTNRHRTASRRPITRLRGSRSSISRTSTTGPTPRSSWRWRART